MVSSLGVHVGSCCMWSYGWKYSHAQRPASIHIGLNSAENSLLVVASTASSSVKAVAAPLPFLHEEMLEQLDPTCSLSEWDPLFGWPK